MASFRARLFSSLVVLPTTNALGHLAPAVGACWTAVDMPVWDVPVLVLLFSVHALLDSSLQFPHLALFSFGLTRRRLRQVPRYVVSGAAHWCVVVPVDWNSFPDDRVVGTRVRILNRNSARLVFGARSAMGGPSNTDLQPEARL